ncbi:hypothetical protein ACOMHN_003945 [Nucella lapillus]
MNLECGRGLVLLLIVGAASIAWLLIAWLLIAWLLIAWLLIAWLLIAWLLIARKWTASYDQDSNFTSVQQQRYPGDWVGAYVSAGIVICMGLIIFCLYRRRSACSLQQTSAGGRSAPGDIPAPTNGQCRGRGNLESDPQPPPSYSSQENLDPPYYRDQFDRLTISSPYTSGHVDSAAAPLLPFTSASPPSYHSLADRSFLPPSYHSSVSVPMPPPLDTPPSYRPDTTASSEGQSDQWPRDSDTRPPSNGERSSTPSQESERLQFPMSL